VDWSLIRSVTVPFTGYFQNMRDEEFVQNMDHKYSKKKKIFVDEEIVESNLIYAATEKISKNMERIFFILKKTLLFIKNM